MGALPRFACNRDVGLHTALPQMHFAIKEPMHHSIQACLRNISLEELVTSPAVSHVNPWLHACWNCIEVKIPDFQALSRICGRVVEIGRFSVEIPSCT